MGGAWIAGTIMAIVWLVFLAIAIAAFVFWIRMIIDCTKRNFPNDNDKIVWILVIVLLGIIGAIVYWIVVCKNSKP